jgi:hypothetical protein
MSTHQSRPAIDLAPTGSPRPTLALILALLAVPGSTVAWDLLLGGLWIGLPLALAAIVLELRSRREGSGPKRSMTAIVLASLCIAQMVVWTAVSLAGGETGQGRALTFRALDKGSTFTHIRNTPGAPRRANTQGDVLVFTNPLADASGARIGKVSVACTTTTGARNFMRSAMTCSGTYELRDGTLTVQAMLRVRDRTTVGAVTGGTGAYANARGVFESRTAANGSVDTFTLAE